MYVSADSLWIHRGTVILHVSALAVAVMMHGVQDCSFQSAARPFYCSSACGRRRRRRGQLTELLRRSECQGAGDIVRCRPASREMRSAVKWGPHRDRVPCTKRTMPTISASSITEFSSSSATAFSITGSNLHLDRAPAHSPLGKLCTLSSNIRTRLNTTRSYYPSPPRPPEVAEGSGSSKAQGRATKDWSELVFTSNIFCSLRNSVEKRLSSFFFHWEARPHTCLSNSVSSKYYDIISYVMPRI